jgi:hypothetical protein
VAWEPLLENQSLLQDAPVGGKASSILWGTLQAHRVMREMLLDGFSGFPKLSHVLNLHLQDNTVPRSKFEALEEKVAKHDAKIKALQTSMDEALTKLNEL